MHVIYPEAFFGFVLKNEQVLEFNRVESVSFRFTVQTY